MNTRQVESAESIRSILTDPEWRVRASGNTVPVGLRGSLAGDVFASLARMSDGEDHQRRKQIAVDLIDSLDLDFIPAHAVEVIRSLYAVSPHDLQIVVPGMVVSALLGVPTSQQRALVEHVRALVVGSRPTASESEVASAIEGVERAVPTIADTLDGAVHKDIEHIASRISLIFQASDACAAMIGNALVMLAEFPGPTRADAATIVRDSMQARVPVRSTNRFREGETAVLNLEAAHQQHPHANWTFGFGPHACPGRSIAVAIAVATIEAVIEHRPFDLSAVTSSGWEELPNVWIPILTLQGEGAR